MMIWLFKADLLFEVCLKPNVCHINDSAVLFYTFLKLRFSQTNHSNSNSNHQAKRNISSHLTMHNLAERDEVKLEIPFNLETGTSISH